MPENGGDPERADPERLFVGSLSACHMLWFIALARAGRLRVAAYRDDAVGTLDGGADHRVELDPGSSSTTTGPGVVAELHREAHERCYPRRLGQLPGRGCRMSAAGGNGAGEPTMKISELAEAAGVPVATVRHYLREGLLPEGRKTSRNMAYYPAGMVDRIRLIKLLQEERFMPLKVIRELLEREGGDPEARALAARRGRPRHRGGPRPRARADACGRGQRALRGAASRSSTGSPRSASSAPPPTGTRPSDVRIVEAIARFRAGGYDERIGFTVYDAARFLEPLRALARREVELLSEKLVGRFEPDRAAELIEAGIDPLAELIAAMNSKLITAEIEAHRANPRLD